MLSRLGHGTKEFIVIRVCAFLLLSYTFYLGTYFLLSDEFNFNLWSTFFDQTMNKVITSIFFLAFAVHTWMGTWAVASDYLTPRIFGKFGRALFVSFRSVVAAIIALVLTCCNIRVIFTLLSFKFCIYGYSKLIYNSC